MERLILKSKSREDIKLLAELARKMGITVEYLTNEDVPAVQEPESLAEWDRLTPNQQKGILDAIEDVNNNGGRSHEEVMKAMRKKYE